MLEEVGLKQTNSVSIDALRKEGYQAIIDGLNKILSLCPSGLQAELQNATFEELRERFQRVATDTLIQMDDFLSGKVGTARAGE